MTRLKDVRFSPGVTSLLKPFGQYGIFFAASAVLRLVATIVFLPRLHESTAGKMREAIEFMADNIYDNMRGVVIEPVRRFL